MNTILALQIKGLKFYLLLMACTFIVNANGQDWKWKNPSPTGHQLNCVKFVDSSAAYAIGNYGTVLKSTNGGQNWNTQNVHSISDLLSISVIDKDTVYLSGRDLSVFKTTDGGDTWLTVRNGSYGNRNTSKVFFITSAVGYLLGDGMEELFKTTDAGITWTKLVMELNFQGVTSLYFTTVDIGYATQGGGNVLKTTDGGVHWKTIALPISWPFNSLDFTDPQTGYMVGDLGNILKTEDAGESWKIQNQFPSSLTISNLVSVCFVNKEVGFAVGGKDILKTLDGGLKWEIVAQSAFDLRAVSFVDSDHGICTGGDWLHEFSGILTTSDGGMKWKENSATLTDRYIHKIKFVNTNTGYAVGGNGSTYGGFILKTTDAGNNWSSINTGLDNYYINDLSLPDENTLYMVGQSGQILKSSDSGASWHKQISNTTETLNAVFFLDLNNGYVVGDNQTILKTSNGGTTWKKQVSPKTQHLYSAYFKDINTGYIASYDWEVDSSTVLLTTTNGGLNWKSKRIGTMDYPSKITFVNKDTAFIACYSGGILKTTDGGNHWTASYYHGNNYSDLFFTTENTGYVIGWDGEISMTENCGKDWTLLDSRTDKDLFSICFTDVNTGFAVGSNGIILKTTNSGSSLKPLRQSPYNLCNGEGTLIKPNFIGGAKPLTYVWDHSPTTPSVFVAPLNKTIYKVTISDSEMDTIQINIPVDVAWVLAPVIRQRGDTLISDAGYGNHWFRNDSLIGDVYSQSFVPKTKGAYYSIVYDYSCISEKSNVIQMNPSALDEIQLNDIQIYPNPVSYNLTIELPKKTNECVLILMDTNGKEILRQKTSENSIILNMSSLPIGIYFIQVISTDLLITKKIVKK